MLQKKRPSAVVYHLESKEKKPRSWGKIFCLSLLTLILLGVLVAVLVYYNIQPARRNLQWYHKTVIYQIYPRSFQDSDGDGVGDLKGITQRLDYLKDLGIETIWLSPIFKSPMEDFGYDISNYTDIADIFGSIDDFDAMMKQAKEKRIRVILDFVPNHTSKQYVWFYESEHSTNETNEYHNFYVWHPGHPTKTVISENGAVIKAPPNNWMSVFGNSAWKFSETRKEYYLHQFLESMPDLNWTNPAVREKMNNNLRFWLDRGVHGFRVDALPHLFEIPLEQMVDADETERNPFELQSTLNDKDYEYFRHPYTKNTQATVDFVGNWTKLLADYTKENKHEEPRFLILEVVDKDIQQIMRYYPNDPFGTATMPFYFGLVLQLNKQSTGYDIERHVLAQINALPKGAWPSWVIGNHDQRRATNRLGNPDLIDGLNMLNLLLPGTPTTYYGEEIGMRDAPITLQDIEDPFALNYANATTNQTYNELEALSKTRDYSRSPMQWSYDETSAGFSTNVTTWLPLGEGWNTTLNINVKYQKDNQKNHTHYGLYRELLRIRNTTTFQLGQFRTALVNENIFSFLREYQDAQFLVAVDLRRDSSLPAVPYDFSPFDLTGEWNLIAASTNIYHKTPRDNNSLAHKGPNDNIPLDKVYLEPSAAVVLRITHEHTVESVAPSN